MPLPVLVASCCTTAFLLSAAAADEGEESHNVETEPVYAVLMPWFTQAVGLVAAYLLTRHSHGVPYPCVMFVAGIFMGVGVARSNLDDQLTQSILLWRTIDHEVLFNVGIALALGLDSAVQGATTDPEKLLITFRVFEMVGGVAFLTLIINGTLSGPLLKKLGLADSSETRQRILKCAEDAMRRRMLDDFIRLMTDPRFYFVDFALVMHHCPTLKDLSAEELKQAVEQNKSSVHPDSYNPPSLENVLPYIERSTQLGMEMARTEREIFMGGGSVGLTAINESMHSGFSEEIPEAPSALVQDTRIMFIELLRAAYNAQIRDGEPDPREYHGFLTYCLLQSLEFAHDDVLSGKPLNDWALSHIVSTAQVDKTESLVVRLYGCMCVRGKGNPEQRIHTLKDAEPLRYQELRLEVFKPFRSLMHTRKHRIDYGTSLVKNMAI